METHADAIALAPGHSGATGGLQFKQLMLCYMAAYAV